MVGDPEEGQIDAFELKGVTSPTAHWPRLWGAAEIPTGPTVLASG